MAAYYFSVIVASTGVYSSAIDCAVLLQTNHFRCNKALPLGISKKITLPTARGGLANPPQTNVLSGMVWICQSRPSKWDILFFAKALGELL